MKIENIERFYKSYFRIKAIDDNKKPYDVLIDEVFLLKLLKNKNYDKLEKILQDS